MKKEFIILGVIFLLSLGFNLYFNFQIPQYSSDEAYFNVRHTSFIADNFQPIIYDIQSYGGNYILNTHIWHYLLAFFEVIFGSMIALKIIPALLGSSSVILGYLIAKEITKNEKASYFGGLLFAFIPNFVNLTLNQVSIESLYVPLMLLFIYSIFKIKEKLFLFLISSFLLVALEPMNFLLFLALIILVVLIGIEDLNISRAMKEGIFFYVLLMILFNLILFKGLYLEQGLNALWQNIPSELYDDYFKTIDIFGLIANIGIIPLILGIAGLVIGFLKEKKVELLLLGSILISCAVLLLLKLIDFSSGMMFMAILLSITTVISIDRLMDYIELTKFVKYKKLIVYGLMFIVITSLIIPSWAYAENKINHGVSNDEIDALEWINKNTITGSVIAGNVYEGNLISSIAGRVNIIDTQFITAEKRYLDVTTLFKTESLVKAQGVIKKYDIDYIYFSEKTKNLYDVEELKYTSKETCFEEVFKNEAAIVYKVVC